MTIKTHNYQATHFVISAPDIRHLPEDTGIEVAFARRSNAGKSSALNALTQQKSLARTSKTPGRTQLINLFEVTEGCRGVDLPGYGYARVSKNERGEFSKLITDYVFRSEKIHFLFVLVDSRLEPQAIDLRFIRLLGEHGIPFGIVFTKTDKLSRNQLESSAARYKKQLLTEWEELPPLFFASSAKRTGREEILAFIDKCLKDS